MLVAARLWKPLGISFLRFSHDSSSTMPYRMGLVIFRLRKNTWQTLGLSTAHVNRVVKQLREAKLVSFTDGSLSIHDFDRLAELCEFDRSYVAEKPVI